MVVFFRFDRFKMMRFKEGVKETFRHHSLEEYREFFTRGMGSDDGENRVYPWIYTRLFLMCFAIFGFVAFIIRLTGNSIAFPTLVVMGAFLITAPFTVLLFELNPKRDLSFLKVAAVLIIGSVIADIIIQLGYFAFDSNNEWLSVLWTAFLEEFGKAVPAILAILILKKRGNPMACFIIAAAVGAGTSVAEDMGYILFSSGSFYIDLTETVTVSILRAVTSVCTHIVWTGFIGWAFGKFKRPLIDFRFWGICIFSMALHFCWDMPSLPLGWTLLSLFGCVVAAIWVMEIIIKKERRKVLGGPLLEIPSVIPAFAPSPVAADVGDVYEMDAANDAEETAAAAAERDFTFQPVPENDYGNRVNGLKVWHIHAANTALAVMLAVLSVLGVASCYLEIGDYYKQKTFYDASDFKAYVQSGYEFDYDAKRKYDEAAASDNYSEFKREGKLINATQKVADGKNDGIFYYFNYQFSADEEAETKEALVSVDVGVGEKIYSKSTIPAYSGDDEAPAYYFGGIYVINSDVSSCYYDDDSNEYVVNMNETEFRGTGSIIALSVIAGLALLSCGTVCIINYIKAGKEHD